jgi:hypothetical protein
MPRWLLDIRNENVIVLVEASNYETVPEDNGCSENCCESVFTNVNNRFGSGAEGGRHSQIGHLQSFAAYSQHAEARAACLVDRDAGLPADAPDALAFDFHEGGELG